MLLGYHARLPEPSGEPGIHDLRRISEKWLTLRVVKEAISLADHEKITSSVRPPVPVARQGQSLAAAVLLQASSRFRAQRFAAPSTTRVRLHPSPDNRAPEGPRPQPWPNFGRSGCLLPAVPTGGARVAVSRRCSARASARCESGFPHSGLCTRSVRTAAPAH